MRKRIVQLATMLKGMVEMVLSEGGGYVRHH